MFSPNCEKEDLPGASAYHAGAIWKDQEVIFMCISFLEEVPQ